MPKVTYRSRCGNVEVDAGIGHTLMDAAVGNDIPGIVAECGGNAMCATCHVYVEGGPIAALPPVSEDEDEMLDVAGAPREPNSRLSCRIPMTAALAGLVVRVAEGPA